MARQAIDNGRWFDTRKATKYEEDTRWDGRNHVSLATGSQWEHQSLYRTTGGNWVLHEWSQWQGSTESWTQISASEAAEWLVANGEEPHPDLATEHAALEVP